MCPCVSYEFLYQVSRLGYSYLHGIFFIVNLTVTSCISYNYLLYGAGPLATTEKDAHQSGVGNESPNLHD